MTFFESLLLLMLVAIALLQVARRLSLPYPAMLAGAGLILAFIPGTPVFEIDPETYLALFIAPVLVDAAFDFPPGAMSRLRAPLLSLAVGGVLLTAGVVAWMAHSMLGISIAAGLALGGIVAPPDAAAARAVRRGLAVPRPPRAQPGAGSALPPPRACSAFSRHPVKQFGPILPPDRRSCACRTPWNSG